MSLSFTQLEERLERGEIVTFEPCPFALPGGNDLSFLMHQQLKVTAKNISFNPENGAVSGFVSQSDQQTDNCDAAGEFRTARRITSDPVTALRVG